MAEPWLTVARYDTQAALGTGDRELTTRFLGETAGELQGYVEHTLYERSDGTELVCVTAWHVERSAHLFADALRDGSEQLSRSLGAELQDVSVMRQIATTSAADTA